MSGNTSVGDWSAEDRQSIAAQGLTTEEVERQLGVFRTGVPPVRLNRSCRTWDGIIVISETEKPNLLNAYQEARQTRRIMKFVPASGAASRMFREWYRCLNAGGFDDEAERSFFKENLNKYAFFADLRAAMAAKRQDIDALIANRKEAAVLQVILSGHGLNYGFLPKALLKFHAYPEGGRTALEEHLVEAALYARDSGNISRLHFTVSREHETAVKALLARVVHDYESRLDTIFDVGISTQDPATDTVAVDMENRLLRTDEGKPVFRPGGHGSLLLNLNRLDEDIIFIKNIDNVVLDRFKAETVLWKKILAGYLIQLQEKIFAWVRLLAEGNGTDEELERVYHFAQKEVNLAIRPDFRDLPRSAQRSLLLERLNRPIRVCGMVKNEGEPGGGPFWVDDPDGKGGASLQIIEESQIDRADPKQHAVWLSATHFNPVDIVCGVRDFRGRKFDLALFVDPTSAAMTRKSEKGRRLLALERPGLWNGSMAFWNTVFIEVPLATFNPIKTIDDLLRPQHV